MLKHIYIYIVLPAIQFIQNSIEVVNIVEEFKVINMEK